MRVAPGGGTVIRESWLRSYGQRGIALAGLLLAGMLPMEAGAQARAQDDSVIHVMLATGDAAWDRGRRDSAYAAYRAAVQRDTAASIRVLVRLATLEVERHRTNPAAALLRAHLLVAPDDGQARLSLARLLAWSARYRDAIAHYDSVLARDSTNAAATLGRAQALAWAGRFTEAEREFEVVVRRDASPEGERGLARLAAWRGDVMESERRWRSLTARYPGEVENWIGLAQAQRWAGHIAAADSALRRALALDPNSADAREQWHQVQSDLSHAAEPTLAYGSDSDGNRSTSQAVTLHSRDVGVLRWRATGARRETELADLRGSSVGARARLSWSTAESRVIAAAELGASRLSSRIGGAAQGAATRGSTLLLLSGASRGGNRVTVGWSRSPFDETAALMARGLVTSSLDVAATAAPSARLGIDVAVGRTRIVGGSVPNARTTFSGSVRWSLRPALTLVGNGQDLACVTTGVTDGYFCPARLRLLEALFRAGLGAGRPWGFTTDVGVGRQYVRDFSSSAWRTRMAMRTSAAILLRPTPGYQIEALYGFSTLASPVTQDAADYRATMLSLRLRLRL